MYTVWRISVLRQAMFELSDLWHCDLHNFHHVIHWSPMQNDLEWKIASSVNLAISNIWQVQSVDTNSRTIILDAILFTKK